MWPRYGLSSLLALWAAANRICASMGSAKESWLKLPCCGLPAPCIPAGLRIRSCHWASGRLTSTPITACLTGVLAGLTSPAAFREPFQLIAASLASSSTLRARAPITWRMGSDGQQAATVHGRCSFGEGN